MSLNGLCDIYVSTQALVAQLDRASPSEGEGREFESRQARHFEKKCLPYSEKSGIRMSIGLSPSGKATGFDPVIRWFESSQPSQNQKPPFIGGFCFVLSRFGERSKVRRTRARCARVRDAIGGRKRSTR